MKTFARCLPALLLAAFLSSPALADDVKKEEPKKPDVKKEEPKKPDVKKEEPKKPDVKKEEPKKPDVKKEEPKKPEPFANVFTFAKGITPDEKQAKAIADLKKEYLPKLQEIAQKEAKILTPERAKLRAEARKKAQADGKKGAELNKIGHTAMNLSEDENKELGQIVKEASKLRGEVNKKKNELLTEEQKKLLQPKPKAAK